MGTPQLYRLFPSIEVKDSISLQDQEVSSDFMRRPKANRMTTGTHQSPCVFQCPEDGGACAHLGCSLPPRKRRRRFAQHTRPKHSRVPVLSLPSRSTLAFTIPSFFSKRIAPKTDPLTARFGFYHLENYHLENGEKHWKLKQRRQPTAIPKLSTLL